MLRSSSQEWGVVGETDCTTRFGIWVVKFIYLKKKKSGTKRESFMNIHSNIAIFEDMVR